MLIPEMAVELARNSVRRSTPVDNTDVTVL